jgi:hypothetical protein
LSKQTAHIKRNKFVDELLRVCELGGRVKLWQTADTAVVAGTRNILKRRAVGSGRDPQGRFDRAEAREADVKKTLKPIYTLEKIAKGKLYRLTAYVVFSTGVIAVVDGVFGFFKREDSCCKRTWATAELPRGRAKR